MSVSFAAACKTAMGEFRTLYKSRAELSRAGDLAAMMNQTTPDYLVRVQSGQTMTRQQLEERIRAYLSRQLIKQISFEYVVKSVDLRDDRAVVVVEQRDKRIQKRADGKDHEVEANVIHRDTWIKTTTGWKLQLTEEQEQTRFTVDGKPVR